MTGATYIIGFLLLCRAAAWTVDITNDISVHMNHVISIPFNISNNLSSKLSLNVTTLDNDIAIPSFQLLQNENSFNGILNITGVFLGRTKLVFTLEENGVSAKALCFLKDI